MHGSGGCDSSANDHMVERAAQLLERLVSDGSMCKSVDFIVVMSVRGVS